MHDTNSASNRLSKTKRHAWFLAVGWTLFMVILGAWAVWQELAAARTLARGEARAHFRKDQAFRLWASAHGGVYVPASNRTPPNPNLAHIPERDIRTESGVTLTLMNPAYMLRQMMDEYGQLYGVKGRIVSDKPLREANAADPWERAALEAFRRGARKAQAFTEIGGEPYLRWMEPMMVKPSCLKCHGHQGYAVGDVRGGVGVSVPFAPYLAAARFSIRNYILSLGAIWLVGLVGITLAHRTITQRLQERQAAEKALRDERNLFLDGPAMVFRWGNTEGLPTLYASSNVNQVLGWSPEELVAGDLAYRDLIHPDDLPRVTDEVDRHTRAGDERFEHQPYRLRQRGGGYVWVADYTTILRDDTGSTTQYLGYLVDISRQHESDQRLQLAMEGTNAGLWDWHVPSGKTVFNERWAEIAGYSLAELEPVSIDTWMDLCHPADLKSSSELLEAHLAGRTDYYRCEARMKHKDGRWVWVLDQGKVVERDHEGKPVRLAGTHIDITEQKRIDALLAAEHDLASAWSAAATFEKRLWLCLETAISIADMDCGGVYLVDDDGSGLKLTVHQGLSSTFVGRSTHFPSDSKQARLVLQGRPLYTCHRDLIKDSGDAAAREGLLAMAVIPVDFQGRVVACLNVASHTVKVVPERARLALESIASYIGAFIHQEVQARKTRQNQKNMLSLFNTIKDMLFILDTRGVIIGHNRVAAECLGYADDELIGKHVLFVHPEERHSEAQSVLAAMMKGETDTCPIPLQTKSGGLIPVETKVVPGQWHGQEVIFGVSRDISQRLEMERRERQMEKAESLSRMAGAVAHHFNNQLAAVIGNLELAREELLTPAEIADYIARAEQAAGRAAELSKTMVSFVGQAEGSARAIDLSLTCREHVTQLRETAPQGALLDTELPLPGPVVLADPAQVGQILGIMVANGWEAGEKTPTKVRISVSVADKKAICNQGQAPAAWAPSADNYACLQVVDNGRGMDKNTIDRIFDPFFTDKFTGRGLGLPVVLGIVKSWNGCITVDSMPGRGSTFRVFLPLSLASPFQTEPATAESLRATPRGGIVLLAEDEPMVRDMAQKMLERFGFEVLTAEDGQAAFEVFQKRPSEIRLVISDLTMPRMNGWDTLAALRKIKPDIPVILASGYDESQAMAGDHAERPQAFLSKPFNTKTLRQAVDTALGKT